MNKAYDIQTIEADNECLRLAIDGKTYRLSWQDCSPRLAKETPSQRKHFEVPPAGYGIHWPEVDEDLAITLLIEQAEEHLQPAFHQVGEKKGKYRIK